MHDNEDIHEKILNKIDQNNCDDSTKSLLKELLIFELGRSKGEKYKKEYKKQIEKVLEEGD